jgi:hypothetical protein
MRGIWNRISGTVKQDERNVEKDEQDYVEVHFYCSLLVPNLYLFLVLLLKNNLKFLQCHQE